MSAASAPSQDAPAPLEAQVAPNLSPPPGNPRFPEFDALRAIAALSVFLGHTVTGTLRFSAHPQLYVYAVELADQGVAIFFLISGFLLYRPFLVARRGGPPLRLGGFARRRLLRIVPAYWAALSLFLLTGAVSGVTTHNWWTFYGFGQIYSAQTIGSGIGAAWTLCIEMTFYAALPLFSLVAARLGGRRPGGVRGDLILLVVLSVASLGFRARYHAFGDFATVSTLPGTFTWFAVGMALAVASVTQDAGTAAVRALRALAARPLLGLAGAVALFYGLHRLALGDSNAIAGALGEHVIYALVAMLVLLPGIFPGARRDAARALLGSRLLSWIGLVSYAFYLYHTIVIQELNRHLPGVGEPARYLIVLVAGFALSSLCAAASYYLLERPCMRWGRRARRAPAPA